MTNSKSTNDNPSNSQTRLHSKGKSTYQLQFASIAILMVSLFPLFSRSPVFELFSHFRLQMMIASIAVIVFLMIFRCKLFLIPAVVALVLNCAPIYPLYFGSQERATLDNFRVLTMNVSVSNREFSAVEACIKDSKADVVCIQELSPEMSDYLAKNLIEYPYRLVDPRPDPFGSGIYSRRYINTNMLIPSEAELMDQPGSPGGKASMNALMVGITVGDQNIRIITAHPPPPLRQDAFDWRNRQLEFIADMAAKSSDPTIIAGDLNCTAYSPIFSKLLKQGQLNDSEIGFGIQPTWPTTMLPLIIPIDHVLYRGPIRIVDRRLGLSTGSDHTPVVVSFKIGDRSQSQE